MVESGRRKKRAHVPLVSISPDLDLPSRALFDLVAVIKGKGSLGSNDLDRDLGDLQRRRVKRVSKGC